MTVSKIRRIGTTALQYRDARTEDGAAQERETVLAYISLAGRLGIDLLLFQEEYSFVSQSLEADAQRRWFSPATPPWGTPSRKDTVDQSITLDDPYVGRVRQAAEQAKVNVALPVLERAGADVFNSLVPITASGEMLRPYRKMHPVVGGETPRIREGEHNRAQLLAGIPVSFAICFDIHFDDVFEAARASGAKLVLWASMWMGGTWLRARAVRYGYYVVSATPDGCTFVDMDGSTIAESFSQWPQTAGHNNLVYEDLNFDREVIHCWAGGKLNRIRDHYGDKVHIRNRPQDSIAIVESLDPDLTIEEIKDEFGLESWYDYIVRCTTTRDQALAQRSAPAESRTTIPVGSRS